MVLHRNNLDKVRCGLAKCPSCGTYYDPTYGPCPHCAKRYNLATIAFAVVVLLFLLFWLPLEAGAAKAQEVPPETPQISATWWVPTLTPFEPTDTPEPVPTPTVTRRPTATPSMTPTPIVIQPLPQHYVWLPVVRK